MHTPIAHRLRQFGVVTLLIPLAGCGIGFGTNREKQPSLESVMEQVQADARAILEAAAPDTGVEMEESALAGTRPCGGVVGTSMTKVRGQVEAAATETVADVDEAARAGAAAADEQGYETHDRSLAGGRAAEVGLLGGPASGSLEVDRLGRVTVGFETDCLDNPDY